MITIRIAPLATKDPTYDLDVRPTDTPEALRSMIQHNTGYDHQMNLWFLEIASSEWKSVQQLGKDESDLDFKSLGIEKGSIVCLETAMDVALLALAKHENNPMKALWEVLSHYQSNVEVYPIAMAIVNFPNCGLDKRWVVSDGKLIVTNWDQRRNWLLGNGATPLLIAAHTRRMDVFLALISAGANVNAATDEKQTALHIMCQYGILDGVRTLLERGADMAAKTCDGMSPLLIAAQHNHSDIIQYLFLKGADINDQCLTGESALHLAVGESAIKAIKSLVECGANVGLTCQTNNFTPLHKAASRGNVQVIEALVASGSDVLLPNSSGYTPLLVAVNYCHVDAIRTLIEKGASIHSLCKDGDTPLHWAAYKGNLAVIELLISKGADISAVGKHGFRPYQCFEYKGTYPREDEASSAQIRALLAPKKMTFNFKF